MNEGTPFQDTLIHIFRLKPDFPPIISQINEKATTYRHITIAVYSLFIMIYLVHS